MNVIPEELRSLDKLADGAVLESYLVAMEKVQANATDYNTEFDSKRSITITINFKVLSDDRSAMTVEASVNQTLAKDKPVVITAPIWRARNVAKSLEKQLEAD
jgi:hypothetical protein